MSDFKRVPVEPTPEMIEAGMNALKLSYDKEDWMQDWVRAMYLAMAAAAPKPDDERACEWRSGSISSWESEEWYGECGIVWVFPEDGPLENEVHYCSNCGGKVRIKEERT